MSPVVDLTTLRLVQLGNCFEAIDMSKGAKRIGVALYEVCEIGVVSPLAKEIKDLELTKTLQLKADFISIIKSRALGIIKERYNMDRCIYFSIVSVLPEYAKQGIGQRFTNFTKVLMQELNIDLGFAIYTSAYSYKMAIKTGAELIYKLNYDEYLKEGEQVFKTKPPHDAVRVCVRFSDKYKQKIMQHKL